jgi:hypothetical protein
MNRRLRLGVLAVTAIALANVVPLTRTVPVSAAAATDPQPVSCVGVRPLIPGGMLLPPPGAPSTPACPATTGTVSAPATCAVVAGYNDKCPLWASDPYDGPAHGFDQPGAGIVDHVSAASPDGSAVFVTGETQLTAGTTNTPQSLVTVAYGTAAGSELWNDSLSNVDGFPNGGGNSLAVSPDGAEVFAAGFVADSAFATYQWAVVALDARTGQQRWLAAPPAVPAGDNSEATSVAVSPDGNRVYATGFSFNPPPAMSNGSPTEGDAVTVAYDAGSGAQLWQATYHVPTVRTAGAKLRLSPDGRTVYVAGSSLFNRYAFYEGLSKSLTLLAYQAADGTTVRTVDYRVDQAVGPGPVGFSVSPDGTRAFMVTDGIDLGQNNTFLTVGFDLRSGTKLWSVNEVPANPGLGGNPNSFACGTFDGPWHGSPIGSSPDGSRVYVTGIVHDSDCDSSMVTVAYDAATGAHVWVSVYVPVRTGDNCLISIHASSFSILGCSLVVSRDDRVYSFGNTWGPEDASEESSAVAYDGATGDQLWQARYVAKEALGLNRDVALAGALSPDGSRLYLAEGETDTTRQDATDIVVIAYDTGATSATAVPEGAAAAFAVLGAVALLARRRRRRR